MSSQHLAEVISNFFIFFLIAVFFGLLAAEKLAPYRTFDRSVLKESLSTNLTAFFFNNLFLTAIRATSLFFVAQEFGTHGLLRGMTEGPLKWILTFLLYDLAIYAWHLLSHHNEFLWRFHKIHHSDKAFNVTTGFRFHVIDLLIEIPYKCLFVILFGVDAHIMIAMEAVQLIFILFHHANLRIPDEGRISNFFITPSLHRAHHSSLRAEHDSNYGIVFAIWDRIFKTRSEIIPEQIGLDLIIAQNFIQLLCLAVVTERHVRKILKMIPNFGNGR